MLANRFCFAEYITFGTEMKTKSLIIFFSLSIILANIVFAQDDDIIIDPVLIILKGQVVNIDDGMPVPYAHVVNMRTHGGTTTDASGRFSLEMLNVDSLALSVMGYVKVYFHVPHDYDESEIFTVYAKPVRFAIKEVEVRGQKQKIEGLPQGKVTNISPELRGDAFNEKPPLLAAFFNPVSFWYYHLNKKEKEKRKVRQAIVSEERWQMMSRYYNKKMVMALTGLNEYDADDFMIYFNSKGILNHISSEYEVRAAILEQYKLFMIERTE